MGSLQQPSHVTSRQSSARSRRGGKGKHTTGTSTQQEEDAKHGYLQAVGYGDQGEADFERLWRGPIQEVLSRSFSAPAVGPASSTESADSLDEFMDLQFVHSSQGKMKARCIVRPKKPCSSDCVGSTSGSAHGGAGWSGCPHFLIGQGHAAER